ncbi:dihydroorotase [Bacteroidota bacterium]
MKILLKGLTLINPEQKLHEEADLFIENGIINEIGKDLEVKNAEVFEFYNKYCTPGFFDMHVHLREPGREDEETIKTGLDSAAAGGFTGVACMPNTSPPIDSAEVVRFIKDKGKSHLVDVYPIAAATLGRKGENLSPMAELYDSGALAFSDDGVAIKTSEILRSILEYSQMFGIPVIDHCEDPSLSHGVINEGITSTKLGLPPLPSVSEDIIVARDLLMAEYTDGRVHIAHISTKKSVDLVREAKKKQIKITTEVTPHHFTLSEESLRNYDTNFKMSPPLRTKSDIEAIIEGLKDGTIDCIASDHAPHAIEEKEMEFIYAPNGIIGLETQIGLIITELIQKKHLTLDQTVEKLSINPRKILNLSIPRIEKGKKANLTIFDTETLWTVDVSKFKSKSKNSPFDKRLLNGKSVSVINKQIMYFEDQYIDLTS